MRGPAADCRGEADRDGVGVGVDEVLALAVGVADAVAEALGASDVFAGAADREPAVPHPAVRPRMITSHRRRTRRRYRPR